MRTIEIKPEHINTYNLLNNFLSRSYDINRGIEGLISVSKLVENPKNIYMNIANLYSLDQTKINNTLEYFVKAYELDQTDKNLCGHIANLYSKEGNVDKANYYTNIYISLN